MALLVSTMRLQTEYHTWRNRMDVEVNLRVLSGNSSTTTASVAAAAAYEIYMYIGCTVSPFAAVLWHFNQAVKVCDAANLDSACNIKMKKNYDYDELAFKAKDWLLSEEFNAIMDKNEVIVKLDDDTIIAKDTLDRLVGEFMAGDCQYAGNMRYHGDERIFWSNGPLFMVKTGHLRRMLKENSNVLSYFKKAEDVQMGALLRITDDKLVCNVNLDTFRHRYYEDKRLSIRYKPYVK
ncbi:hypothetical protein BG011_007355, partial [Mortierella polycephala]